MRIRIVLRILLTLYILSFIFIAGIVIFCAWGLIDRIHPQWWLDNLYGDMTVKIIATAIAALIIGLSLKFIFTGGKEKRVRTKTLKETEGGSIRISVLALQDMVTRYVVELKDVRNHKVKIITNEKGIDIDLKLAVIPGTNIPELTSSLQAGLKDNIETFSGICVNHVDILVADTSLTGK